jgi:enhancer of polycomb-like protein
LQAVLSAASQRNQAGSHRSTRGSTEKKSDTTPAAYIPTPDSTGIVDNYEELYKPNRWEDPATYIRSSETVEECCENALANQFTYYMDERDKEWLDKNNEEARGEGTSAQGALSTPGTTTRSGLSSRSAKARGKEPEVTQPVVVSEEEFELVMGLFERVTHEKTEYLHHVSFTFLFLPQCILTLFSGP